MQAAVLRSVLAEHPALLGFPQLAERVFESTQGFTAAYSLARAVRDLGVVGLVQCNGLLVWPSPAALRFDELRR